MEFSNCHSDYTPRFCVAASAGSYLFDGPKIVDVEPPLRAILGLSTAGLAGISQVLLREWLSAQFSRRCSSEDAASPFDASCEVLCDKLNCNFAGGLTSIAVLVFPSQPAKGAGDPHVATNASTLESRTLKFLTDFPLVNPRHLGLAHAQLNAHGLAQVTLGELPGSFGFVIARAPFSLGDPAQLRESQAFYALGVTRCGLAEIMNRLGNDWTRRPPLWKPKLIDRASTPELDERSSRLRHRARNDVW
jgi:hypothetical protein